MSNHVKKSYLLAPLFFLFSILSNGILSNLSITLQFGLLVIAITTFYNNPKILFFFLIYSYFLRHSFNGTFFGIELDPNTNINAMSNVSNIAFISIILITLFRKVFFNDIKLPVLSIKNPIIKYLFLFFITQCIGTVFSQDILISIQNISRLIQLSIWFYLINIYLDKIGIKEIYYFMCSLGIISASLYIYNLVLLDIPYHDDGNIMYLIPFLFNLSQIANHLKGKLIFFYGLIGSYALAFVDSRRFMICIFMFLNNFLYRVISKKPYYYLGIVGTIIFLFFISEFFSNINEFRIFNTLNIIKRMLFGGFEDTSSADMYNIFTKRDVLFSIGIESFLESPIFGLGSGMSKWVSGQIFFGEFYPGARFRLHNLYLEIAADTGIVGVAAYIILLVTVIKVLLKISKSHLLLLEEKIMTWVLLDIFIITIIMNFLGSRGPYDKYEWFFYAMVYFLSKKHLQKNNSISQR